MLLDLAEFDGVKAVLAAIHGGRLSHAGRLIKIFDHLVYLFYGRAHSAPNVWIAGALTREGVSVTGSGRTLEEALLGVAGETSEAGMRAVHVTSIYDPLLHGYGSHTLFDRAAHHARYELIERICVTNWWCGGGRGELWDRKRTAKALEDCGQGQRTPERELRFFDVTKWPDITVIVALSFDRSGYGFCFGAACRSTVREAASSAANELVQAEFGLQLALMKQKCFGTEYLSKSDQLALLHARTIDRDRILASEFTASPVSAKSRDGSLDGIPHQIELRNLGVFEGLFHVVEANSLHSPTFVSHDLKQPFAEIPLY